jgi:hypothetical protein
MASGKLRFTRFESAVIAGIEARTSNVVILLCGKRVGRFIGALTRPSTHTGIATLRAHCRECILEQVRENRRNEFSIGDLNFAPFTAFTGFPSVDWENCQPESCSGRISSIMIWVSPDF